MVLRSVVLGAALVFAACSSTPGPQGPQGDPGPAGAQGPAGPVGPQGVPGPMGAEGVAGPPGPVGPAGMVLVIDGGVVTGPPGSSVVIAPLNAGAACPTGGVRVTQVSDGGTVDVCNGQPGPSPSISPIPTMSPACPTGGLLVGLPDGGSLPLCNGAQGLQGPVGPQGAQGPQGLVGMTGPAGVQGPAGPQGPVGPAGAVGPQGPVGAAGPQGAPGPQGPVGPAGAVGPTGAQGPAGPTGATGAQGPAGPTGATGAQGPAGPQGPMGPAGSVLYLDGGVVVASEAPVEFVGFTTATYTGNLGGLPGAAAKCSLDFPNSYLCTLADYDRANTTVVPPTSAGAWVDNNRTDDGTRSTSPCTQSISPWTSAATPYSTSAPYLGATGYAGTITCAQSKHLTCCRGRPGTFRGFTAMTYTGDLGGIPGANAKCRVDYPGSWLCTISEYDRSNSQLLPPTAAGAWVDFNRTASGMRSTSACTQSISPWTSPATPYSTSAAWIGATGYAGTITCAQSKHLACCGG